MSKDLKKIKDFLEDDDSLQLNLKRIYDGVNEKELEEFKEDLRINFLHSMAKPRYFLQEIANHDEIVEKAVNEVIKKAEKGDFLSDDNPAKTIIGVKNNRLKDDIRKIIDPGEISIDSATSNGPQYGVKKEFPVETIDLVDKNLSDKQKKSYNRKVKDASARVKKGAKMSLSIIRDLYLKTVGPEKIIHETEKLKVYQDYEKTLYECLDKLDERKLIIIRFRFGLPERPDPISSKDKEPILTLKEISKILKISTERVFKLEKDALIILQRCIESNINIEFFEYKKEIYNEQ